MECAMSEQRSPSSAATSAPDPAVEQQVETLVERFVEDLRAGAAPDRQALLAKHPEIAEPLARRLALVETMYRVAQASRGGGGPPASLAQASRLRHGLHRAARAIHLHCP